MLVQVFDNQYFGCITKFHTFLFNELFDLRGNCIQDPQGRTRMYIFFCNYFEKCKNVFIYEKRINM